MSALRPEITLYHAPGTRSQRVKMLLSLIGLPWAEKRLDIRAGAHKRPEYLTINPFGLVPGLTVNGVPVVDSAAQMILLADMDPECRLAPKQGDDRRATYISWMVMVPAYLEPAAGPLLRGDAGPQARDAVSEGIRIQTEMFEGPFCLGAQPTSLDIMVHWNMRHMDRLGVLEGAPIWKDFIARLNELLDWDGLESTQ